MSSNILPPTLDKIFNPRSVAVIGVSGNDESSGYRYLENTIAAGFKGELYPVHPSISEVLGMKVYPSISEIPVDSIDYIICCINADRVLEMMSQCRSKNVKAIHFFTARMSETGETGGRELEEKIAREAKKMGIHIIGPNCMGLYSPGAGMTFGQGLSTRTGQVGLISQSGGLAGDIVKLANYQGVFFSKAVSYGNAVDINESDLLDYFLWDPETRIILIYIEGVRDGGRFYRSLRRACGVKPVIILKGGRGTAGMKSAASHTASVAGSFNTWDVLFRQTGAIQASNLEELTELALVFSRFPNLKGNRVGIIGGAGGKSVLSADECEEAGLDLSMSKYIMDFLEEKDPLAARWLGNPIDMSILSAFNTNPMELFQLLCDAPDFDMLFLDNTRDLTMFFKADPSSRSNSIAGMLGVLNQECIRIYREQNKPILVAMGVPELHSSVFEDWRWKYYFELRDNLIEASVPVFPSINRAAAAVGKLVGYIRRVGKL